ncbi:hypothetical protein [Halorubrum distributum]|uniref:Uncharacterized protein n=1 Tax=Halorubrum distributum JCM 13916 TaxID=1230455 RepID=M0PRS5_9EURY|nr:hypothetical protein [Halorubrum arcis]EMA72717.1 hypothetical protein C462_00477 [Halorubrum arcis JCM 13916]
MTRHNEGRPLRDGIEPPEWLDGDDPYANVDIDRLPDWWRDAVVEFREHNLSPYQPPRFADDTLVPPLLDWLETAYGVEIQLMGLDVAPGEAWGIRVDGDVVATVDRERTSDGYTRYEMTSERFIEVVEERVGTSLYGSHPEERG